MKTKNKGLIIFLIVFLSILAVAITGLMILLMTGKFSFRNWRFFSTVSKEVVVNETYNEVFEKIDISSEAGDIYIKTGSDNEVKVVIYGKKDNTKVTTTNGVLDIDVESDFCIGICINNSSQIEVYLPSNYDGDFKIENDYGDIEIGEFASATVDVEEDAGDVSVLKADKVKINNNFGDIKVGEAREADVYDSAGDIIITKVYDAKVGNAFGDIEIESVLNSLDVENDCGDIIIDNLNITKDAKIVDSFGDIKIGKTNEIYIKAKTNLGNVKVKNNYEKSDVTLTIENDCGDIKVDN